MLDTTILTKDEKRAKLKSGSVMAKNSLLIASSKRFTKFWLIFVYAVAQPVLVAFTAASFGLNFVSRRQGFPTLAKSVVGISHHYERSGVRFLDFQFDFAHFLIAHHDEKHFL